jgi:nucleoside-diphosphate-sugar epimerase
MTKILITGANGYIGKSLYNAYKDIYDVTIISRNDFDLRDTNQTIKYFSDKYFDVVIHCAISGGSRLKIDDWNVADDNLRMYYNLLACENKFDKLINFGSGAEIHQQDAPYGLSKHIISRSITSKTKFFSIRIYGVFDENELDTRFIKSNLKRYINQQPILIQNKRMTFFYMEDLITLVKHYIDTPHTKLIKECNCSYFITYTMLEIANIINNLSSYTVPIYADVNVVKDYDCILHVPYNLQMIGIKEGIKRTYNKLKHGNI